MVRYEGIAICDKCGKHSMCGVHLAPECGGTYKISVVYDQGWEQRIRLDGAGKGLVLCPECVKKYKDPKG